MQGDSLWAIAARHLGHHATPLQVAREWPRWYAANRTVIGPNPNLIRVGQVLTVPTPGAP
jgi:nucleoid-associated protein YgaU